MNKKEISSRADRSVTIGAGEAGIHSHLLHPAAKCSTEVTRIGVKGSVIAPRVHKSRIGKLLIYRPQSEAL